MSTKTKQNPKKTGMSRLLQLACTKKHFIIPAIILSALASIASFIPYIVIFEILKELLNSLPDLSSINAEKLIAYGWYAFGGVVANVLLYFGALCFSHLAAFGTLYQLKVNFATHLSRIPLGIHVVIGSGKLRKIMDDNIEKIETFIAHQLPDLVAALVAPIVMITILMSYHWGLGLAAMVGILVAFYLQVHLYGNDSAKEMMGKYQKSLEDMNNATVEYIRGISVVKAFKQTVYSFSRLHETIKNYTKMVIPYTLSWENSFSGFITVVNNIYLFIVPVGIIIGMNTNDFNAFLPKFLFYIIFVPAISSTMMKIMYVSSSGMQIIHGVEVMDNILEIPELEEPKNQKLPSDYSISFENVSFRYNDSETNAISNISFTAKQGEITAIVGASGGGKSTIAHLIPRFFDVSDGKITLGNIDIKQISTEKLMDNISFVFQDVFLFKQSVKDNIAMSNPDATEEEIINSAKAAQCHDFIMQLPNGYDTIIGTRGVHLSGGEKQRIAIARAIIKDAPVIVLDEATAFSDPENEHLIQKAFEHLMKGKTVIMIAHRLSTIQSADKILVIDNGKLIEQGNHKQLVEQNGKYANMWRVYQETSSWKIARKEIV